MFGTVGFMTNYLKDDNQTLFCDRFVSVVAQIEVEVQKAYDSLLTEISRMPEKASASNCSTKLLKNLPRNFGGHLHPNPVTPRRFALVWKKRCRKVPSIPTPVPPQWSVFNPEKSRGHSAGL